VESLMKELRASMDTHGQRITPLQRALPLSKTWSSESERFDGLKFSPNIMVQYRGGKWYPEALRMLGENNESVGRAQEDVVPENMAETPTRSKGRVQGYLRKVFKRPK
jgi:hypothetical protein